MQRACKLTSHSMVKIRILLHPRPSHPSEGLGSVGHIGAKIAPALYDPLLLSGAWRPRDEMYGVISNRH